jgi:HPt (histidine-containing phosphotransfer) domain-containing protein
MQKCINLGYLESLTKSNPKLMTEMIAAYTQQTPTLVEAMKEGIQNNDWELLRASAHKMIPSFSIMGVSSKFKDMAKKINSYTGDLESQKEEIRDLILQLSAICNQSCEELQKELENIKKVKIDDTQK